MTQPANSPPPVPGSSLLGRLVTVLAVAPPLVAWTWGQAWRDETWFTGLCFYVPSPLLAVWLMGVAVWLRSIHHRRAAVWVLSLALAPLLSVVFHENQWSRPDSHEVSPGDARRLQIVHWNVKRGDRGWNALVDQLLEQDADAYFLSEAPHGVSFDRFVDYSVRQSLGMAVIARGELSDPQVLRHDNALNAFTIEWESKAGRLRILMADIGAYLGLHRDPQLSRLNGLIAEESPDLVVGDLNAPRLSRRLSPAAEGYRHAYEAAGAGWSYTWPAPVPVYAIDQLMTGPRITPLRHELVSSRLSDHRMQTFGFLFSEQSAR